MKIKIIDNFNCEKEITNILEFCVKYKVSGIIDIYKKYIDFEKYFDIRKINNKTKSEKILVALNKCFKKRLYY